MKTNIAFILITILLALPRVLAGDIAAGAALERYAAAERQNEKQAEASIQALADAAKEATERVVRKAAPVVAVVKKEASKAADRAIDEAPAVIDSATEYRRAQVAAGLSLIRGLTKVAKGVAEERKSDLDRKIQLPRP